VLDQDGEGALGDGAVPDEQDFIFKFQHDDFVNGDFVQNFLRDKS